MYNYWRRGNNMRPRRGMGRGRNRDERCGQQDGSQYGWLQGGMGRNRTDECRHPNIKKGRNE